MIPAPLAVATPAAEEASSGESAAARALVTAELHGDLKTFILGSFPYDWPELEALGAWPTGPTGSGTLVGRARVRVSFAPTTRLDVHHAVALLTGGASGTGLASTGVAVDTPELVALTWRVPADPQPGDATVVGRTDRLVLQVEQGPVTVALGRQPVFFGTGTMFTPLDLVSPFTPATIDTEYTPGVDAVRVDAYGGLGFQQSAVAAWAGSCSPLTPVDDDRCTSTGVADLVLASWTRVTVGVSDVALFLGEVHDDEVIGVSLASAVGPVGVHGDAALTLPPGHLDARDPSEDPFVRAVVGATWRPGTTTTLSGEVYVQTNGAADPADYLTQALGARYARGELWALGRTYAGVAVAQEIRPTVTGSLAVLSNVEDPSLMLAPALSLNAASEVDVSLGAYVGVGARPDGMAVQSELGLVPATVFARVAVYR